MLARDLQIRKIEINQIINPDQDHNWLGLIFSMQDLSSLKDRPTISGYFRIMEYIIDIPLKSV
jgi:hypothetical protein